MYNLRNSKLGMTLVEMVISLVILGILMTSTMGMIVSSNNIFISTSKGVLDKQVGNSVYELMEKVLRYTTHLQIVDEDNGNLNQAISMEETDPDTQSGILMYRKGDETFSLYDSGFYGGRTVQYSVDQYGSDGRHVRLTVNVFREGRRVYQRSSIIRCVNLALIGGSNGNSIVNSATSAFNQILSFSAKEELWAGGDSAWSVEYKAANFMAQYNKILKEYYDKLNPICTDYMNTINQYDNTDKNRIQQAILTEATRRYQEQVFGGTTHVMYEPKNTDMSQVVGEEPITVGDHKEYKNLRTYYQKQIYDLLQFTPTAAFPTATNPQVNKHYAKELTNNPYYGVVATKEELYAGFLLSNYDEDGDGKVTKEEYPSFDNPEDFFGSSTLGAYGIPSSANKQNKMVILGYFMDNTNEKYGVATEIKADSTKSSLIDTVSKTVEYYKETAATYGGDDKWAASEKFSLSNGFNANDATIVTGNSIPADKQIKFDGKLVDHFTINYSYTTDCWFIGGWTESSRRTSHNWSNYYTYSKGSNGTPYTITNNGEAASANGSVNAKDNITSFDNAARANVDAAALAKINSADNLIADLEKNLGAKDITTVANVGNTNKSYTTTGSYGTNEAANYRLITATENIPEGWYYYKDTEGSESTTRTDGCSRKYAYYVFYLKSNPSDNESLTAVQSGKTIHILSKNWTFKYLAYTQAQYIQGTVKDGSQTIDFYTPYLHQYQDWVLYGVDWNSWFAIESGTTGLLNNAILTVRNWVNGIFNPSKVSNDLTGVSITTSGSGVVTSPDATLSLGATGQFTVNSTDRDVKSYNAASMVYHSGRGTWYYLPQNSTMLSVWKSGKSLFSDKDTPIILDVEFRTKNQWESSTDMQNDINNRKLSSSALWGLMDTSSDVNWNALPADNTGVTNSKIVISDVELSPKFNTNQKTYTAETTDAKNVITATYITNDYDLDEISIAITNNGKEVKNGSAITWSAGTNTVVVKVNHVYKTVSGFSSTTHTDTISTYTITVTKK